MVGQLSDKWNNVRRHLPEQIIEALDNPLVTDININPNGTSYATGFLPKQSLGEFKVSEMSKFIKKVADFLDTTVTKKTPWIDGFIEDERLRVEGTMPPVSQNPAMSIRKLATQVYDLESYVTNRILAKEGYQIITDAISNYANMIIAGATGAGKTTLTNAVLNAIGNISPDDRIISIEDTQELIIPVLDRWEHYTTPDFGMTENVKRVLRKHPKRVIVGETRDATILDILNIWNTGHSGGMTTLHAGRTPWKSFKNISQTEIAIDVLERVEDMASLAGSVTDEIRRTISKSVDLIVAIERYSFEEAKLRSGKQNPEIGDQIKVTSIVELVNYDMAKKNYNYNTLYSI